VSLAAIRAERTRPTKDPQKGYKKEYKNKYKIQLNKNRNPKTKHNILQTELDLYLSLVLTYFLQRRSQIDSPSLR